MVRATRSSAGAANLEPRVSSKKRKRVSNTDTDEQPSSKLLKSHSHDPLPSTALSHLHDVDATGILDILEVTDSQGLLDRVFPLPSDAPSQGSFSLRTLLKQASQHPLWVLRAAVQNLFPLSSSHLRSRPSETAIQQHRFCKVALSLLDQASRNVFPVPLTVTSLLDSDSAAASDSPATDDGSAGTAKDAYSYKRYALVQHLPSGDYWTSLNADIHSSTKQLKDLSLGNAELAAVFPTPSKSDSATSVPLLGSYHTQKVASTTGQPAGQRRVPSGTFLDYGLWSSFAPSFDHGYQVVGRRKLGELLYHREKKWEARNQEESIQSASIVEVEDNADSGEFHTDTDAKLDELLPSDLEESLKDALRCLELENAVDELMEKNRRALRRLEELQRERLSKSDGGPSQVEEDSEEWEIAHAILDSLTVLISLRPKSTETKLESIVPPASVLQRLQRTLIRQPIEGWYGTLPPTRATALRDDATVKVRAGSVASTTTPATVTATNPVPTTPYAGYAYTYGQQAYRPPAAAASYAYKQGQYYPTPYLATGGQQLGTQNYYGQQAYAGGTTGQQPYAAYSAWYSQYSAPGTSAPAPAAASSNTGSGRGTPQPAASTTGTAPSTYGNFFPASGTPPPGVARSPAVANTVVGSKGVTAGTTWTSYSTGQQQAGYYGAYGTAR
ncbi:hypothetical protein JOM56_006295 [Amanita muscaria]